MQLPDNLIKRELKPTGLSLAVALALLLPGSVFAAQVNVLSSSTESFQGNDFCSQTTNAAYSSCFYEGQEEFWNGWGACTNIRNSASRMSCYLENNEAHYESLEECQEALEGRDEVCELLGETRYDPQYKPEDFVNPQDIGDSVDPNPFFPLVPGYRWVYETDDEVIMVEVLEDTKVIDGVLCAVVRDIVIETGDEDDEEERIHVLEDDEGDQEDEELGDPVEDTLDWYAQDADGNVWYFGEISLNYEDGEISDVDGSWKTGENEAHPGILMFSMPVVGTSYRQEYFLGEAEDMATVVSLTAQPELGEDSAGDCSLGCLQTREWTPLEADSTEFKFYQPGVGMVLETKPGSDERVELVEFSMGEDEG